MPKDTAEKKSRVRGSTTDVELRYATQIDPALEQWRVLAAEWLASVKEGKSQAMMILKKFLVDYIHGLHLPTQPAEFLDANYYAPCFYSICLSHMATARHVHSEFNYINRFINSVLLNYFSDEDDDGNPVISPAFHNPIPDLPEEAGGKRGWLDESNKNVLPYRFIRELRNIICPDDARQFSDWKWAQAAGDSDKGGDWFVVDESIIDRQDPDCVWRKRKTSEREKKSGYGDEVFEMWSPVRAVALYTKLELPLRTFQVRMLDSGEADTWRYTNGKWELNAGPLAQGTQKNSLRRGVFRQFHDPLTGVDMTGMFINTNKTADRNKDEWSKGYEVPWQHEKVLCWLEKLRNWQEKYNPVKAPTPWTSLERKHVGKVKDASVLKAMGSTCFLFRNAAGSGEDRMRPIAATSVLDGLWYKLLQELERQCEVRNETQADGSKMCFVKPESQLATHYPLHSLRVSLITAYALEGGVPMPILSKYIAGHSRLIMTLYYTKAGITYVSEKMQEAEKRLMEGEQHDFLRWIKDASYRQLEAHGAFADLAAVQAVIAAQASGASLVKDDKGICPKGGWGCDSGGVYVNDDTGTISYGEVPGYPQKNCVRCRWFLTGPAFLPGLVDHFNFIGAQMADTGERIVELEGEITVLEDEQFECQRQGQPFIEQARLDALRKTHQAEMEKNNKLANDYNATLRLISRCMAIANGADGEEGIRLVAAGEASDVKIAIEECSKLQQILTVVAGSAIFPEHDVSKYVLQASQAFDLMLEMNGKPPICFKLTEKDQAKVVQAGVRLIQAQAGSIKEALPFIEGSRKLAEIGLEHDVTRLLENMVGNYESLGVTGQPGKIVRIYHLPKDAEGTTKESANDE